MGTRFRKSIKIAPGVKVNVGKKSTGISVGNKYGGISVNSKTGAKARVSAPGTGLNYTTSLNSKSKRTSIDESDNSEFNLKEYIKIQESSYKLNLILYPILSVLLLIFGWIFPIFYLGLLLILWFEKSFDKSMRMIAIAKYQEACIEKGEAPNDSPSDVEIAPYLPLDGKYTKSGEFKKRKPIYKRAWFIILFAISLFMCYIANVAI